MNSSLEFQDIVNHKYYYDIVSELHDESEFQKVTRIRILDRFLEKNLITKDYHKKLIKNAIVLDKSENKYDMLTSLLITASVLLFFLIAFIPDKEAFTRILFGIYIFCIYLVAYLYY